MGFWRTFREYGQEHMGGQLRFGGRPARQNRHNDRFGVLIANIVLNHQNRANSALFTAQMRFEICVISITTVILLRRGIHCASLLSFHSVGTPLVFDWLTEGIIILGVCSMRFPAKHGTSHHCRFLRFGHAIGSIQSSCTFFGGSVLREYICGRVTFLTFGDDNQLPGGSQRAETALRERLPQRNNAVTALILILFCKLADVVQVLPPIACCWFFQESHSHCRRCNRWRNNLLIFQNVLR